MVKNFNRRNFLKIAGVAAAGAAGAALGRKKSSSPEFSGGDPWPDREERWVASICQLCPGGCGVRVRVMDGRVVKIEGNPIHPVNRGRLCPVGIAAPQLLYHPDRLRTAMFRGRDGQLKPIGWDEAADVLGQKLKALQSQGEAHTAVLFAGHYRGLRERFLRRFMTVLGSPNYIQVEEFLPESPDPSHVLTQGAGRPLAPDLFNARSILSFGVPLLEGGPSPVYHMRAYGHFRQGEGRQRGIFIQVEPHRSATAAQADKWVAVRPGTESTLALGIAHVLILENLYDESFVSEHCDGFDDQENADGQIVPGFRTLVLREFSLPYVSQVTGVSVETILGIARAFAKNQPGVAIGTGGMSYGNGQLGLHLAVHYLNALVGCIGKPGGMLLQGTPPVGDWDPPQLERIAKRSLTRPRVDAGEHDRFSFTPNASEILPERILSGKPYPVKVLLVAGTDPLFDHPRAKDFQKAIERVPFVVSFSSMPDGVTQRAHLVLPDSIFLERWTEDIITHLAGFSAFSVGRPAVDPKKLTQGLEDTLLQVAKKVGGALAKSFEWDSFADAIFEAAAPLAEAGRGYVVSDPVKERFRNILTRQGYWQKEFEDADSLWETLIQRGAWWDPGDEERSASGQLLYPDRKFQFFPDRLNKILADLGEGDRKETLKVLGMKEFKGRLFPLKNPPSKKGKGHIEMVMFRPLALVGSVSAELPWMQEQLGPQVGAQWDSWIEIHPEDAKRLGIRNETSVEVRSGLGALRTHARITKGVPQGIVAMPLGLGRSEGGRWAKGRGVDPRVLVSPAQDSVQGIGAFETTTVRIRRIV